MISNKMKKLLPHELSGNSKSNILVVLLHGFPDTIRLWDGTLIVLLRVLLSDLLKKVPEDV
jgi:pimeloyl-ACP methyl ester carboxylesterase